MLVSQPTIDAVNELVTQCFTENRMLDGIVDSLTVKFGYSKTAELVHENMAHALPLIADTLGEKCLQCYGISVKYGPTPAAIDDYTSVQQICETISNRMIDFQSMLIGACKVAQDNGDLHVYVELLDVLEDFNPFVEQGLILVDLIKKYGNNPSFDKNIEKYWILGKD